MTEDLSKLSSQQLSDHYSRKAHVGNSRGDAMLQVAIEDIQYLDSTRAVVIQSLLQHGVDYGYWQTPKEWAPDGHGSLKRVDLRKRIVDFLPDHILRLVDKSDAFNVDKKQRTDAENVLLFPGKTTELERALDDAVLALTKYLVLLRMGPVAIRDRGPKGPLDPTTIRYLAYAFLPPIAALAVANRIRANQAVGAPNLETRGCFSYVDAKAIETLNASNKKKAFIEVQRMHMLKERGLWSDVPALDANGRVVGTTAVAGEAIIPPQQKHANPHLPLPDEYVAEMGSRSLWIMQQLAPNLLSIVEKLQSIWKLTEDLTARPRLVAERRARLLEALVKDHLWANTQGLPLGLPPFNLRLCHIGRRGRKYGTYRDVSTGQPDWPPRTFSDIMGLIHNVQLAHIFIVTLSIGARKSEIIDLKRTCIRYAVDGMPYADGRTFKLVQSHEGNWRDWVLPDLAAEALEQQVRLVTICEVLGTKKPTRGSPTSVPSTHMWVQLSAAAPNEHGMPLLDISRALVAFAGALGMEKAPGGQNLRTHRLRKTLARLVALALTQAPKILMAVFGHKSIEMTLYYIMADRDLRADVEKVGRELRVMRSKEVIETMVDDENANLSGLSLGGYGGPAALMVGRSIHTHNERLHRRGEEWGAATAQELAEILTLQGKAWEYVRPGVMCTKFPGTESGPCNKSKGHPEPARCQTHCSHRLEEAFLREDVDSSIKDALASYEAAGAAGEELVQALWAGQIRAHIVRFPDLRDKWMEVREIRELVDAPEDTTS